MRLAIAIVVSVAACKHGRWRGDREATELSLAGITIAIPDGWRSLAELSDSAGIPRPGPGSVGMMPERDVDHVITASIVLTVSPRTAVQPWTTCAERATQSLGESSDVHSGDGACSWHLKLSFPPDVPNAPRPLHGRLGVRRLGDQELAVMCLFDAGRDDAAERVCADVLRASRIP